MEVTTVLQPETGENKVEYDNRIANSYYYLGLIESNFGNYPKAINCFREVEKKGQMDFLTMIVLTEAYMMKGDFQKALAKISEIETGLEVPKSASERRWLSRAILMEASIPIMNYPRDWKKAREILEPVLRDDPDYYYATATMAQICFSENNNERAKSLFNDAYYKILSKEHLFAVTEVRVKIHLLMVAGMCCIHGPRDDKRAEDFLDKARGLLDNLPKIDSDTCTVFSNFSKKNENKEVIRDHIVAIRDKQVFVKSQ